MVSTKQIRNRSGQLLVLLYGHDSLLHFYYQTLSSQNTTDVRRYSGDAGLLL